MRGLDNMPKKVHRCVNKVKAAGKSEDSAWAICQAMAKKSGIGKKKK